MKIYKILHLTLKKKWFDMINLKVKKEEYREIKPYWITRLLNNNEEFLFLLEGGVISELKYNKILFKNGYGKNAPSILVDIKSIRIGYPKKEWSFDETKTTNFKNEKCFIIELGENF